MKLLKKYIFISKSSKCNQIILSNNFLKNQTCYQNKTQAHSMQKTRFPLQHYKLVIMIQHAFLLLLVAPLIMACPQSVGNELQLIAQPLDCFRKLYDSAQFDGHRISRVVNERIETYRRMLQQIKMQHWQHLKTTPSVKWAQSQSQIFISFKLSHRQDSPTCSDIRLQTFETADVNVTEGNIPFDVLNVTQNNYSSFSYKGECFFTSQKFMFTLGLQFQGKLSKLTLRKEGLGLYTLVGDKQQKAIWSKPFSNHLKAFIWSEMRNRHSGDMDRYFQILQAQPQSSSKGKRKRRPRKQQKVDNQIAVEL